MGSTQKPFSVTPPKGFERATGVTERRRRCLNGDCKKIFPQVHNEDTNCPYCGSTASKPMDAEHMETGNG